MTSIVSWRLRLGTTQIMSSPSERMGAFTYKTSTSRDLSHRRCKYAYEFLEAYQYVALATAAQVLIIMLQIVAHKTRIQRLFAQPAHASTADERYRFSEVVVDFRDNVTIVNSVFYACRVQARVFVSFFSVPYPIIDSTFIFAHPLVLLPLLPHIKEIACILLKLPVEYGRVHLMSLCIELAAVCLLLQSINRCCFSIVVDDSWL